MDGKNAEKASFHVRSEDELFGGFSNIYDKILLLIKM